MILSIAQALQQGVAAHKEGKLQDAERLYRSILQSQPLHPDANHNLGVLAVSVNKTEEALPLFKTALEANPKIEQFWLSYIDALIKEKQFDNAKQAFEQAKQQGLAGKKLNALRAQLPPIPQTENANSASPSQSELNSLLEHYQNGRFSDAEKLALSITHEFPTHQFAWQLLSGVLKKTGRVSESVVAGEKSVQLAPQDAVAHYNLGNTLRELGRLEEAEQSYAQAVALKPDFAEAHGNLGVTLKELGRLEEAEQSYAQAVALKPDYAEAHGNLGNTLKELGRFEEAEQSYAQAIVLKPDFTDAHYNLGNALQELGRFEEAEASYAQAIALKPDYADAHYNLGITLYHSGKLDEAEASYRQAIALKPDYPEAHSNLGVALKDLGRLEEAEASCRQAIVLKPDFAEPHGNLGNALQELGRLEEAEASCRQAIALKPDFAEAHSNLGIIFYGNGDIDAAIESLAKANDIDPKLRANELVLSVLRARKAREKTEVSVDNINKSDYNVGLASNPLCLNRVVEPELAVSLFEMQSREMDEAIHTPVFGNGRCSPDYNMFNVDFPIIKTVESDLIRLMEEAVKSEIYLYDSWFNIYGAGAGIPPHAHINEFDENKYLNFAKQKYSLVYYVSVGDQDCSEPGIFKLCDPEEEILPCEGMIIIIPAGRRHSAVYNGKKDRIIIGINFYSIDCF
jgi:tetratricopeptide (TPR) repeat protein